MTKTNSRMKWLVVALLVVVAIGAVLLSVLSTPAKATGNNEKVRVFIATNQADADSYAASHDFLPGGVTAITNGRNGAGTTYTYYFPAYIDFLTAISGSTQTIRQTLEADGFAGDTVDLEVYILEDGQYTCNSTDANNVHFSGYSTYKINSKPVTIHLIGAKNGNDNAVPTMLIRTKQTYIYAHNNVIVDHVIIRGDRLNTDTVNPGVSTAVFNTLLVMGPTIEVTNGGAIYNGPAKDTALGSEPTTLTRIALVGNSQSYSNARLQSVANFKNNTDFGQAGKMILNSGTYTNVAVFNSGKFGISTANCTADQVPADLKDRTDYAGYTGDYYGNNSDGTFSNTSPGTNADSDTANWWHYNYDGGASEGWCVIGGTATVDSLRATANGDTQMGKDAKIHLTINDGAHIGPSNTYLGTGSNTKATGSKKTTYSLTQYGEIDVVINGGTFDGNVYGGFMQGYAGKASGQATCMGDFSLTVNDGTFNGTFCPIYNGAGPQSSVGANVYVAGDTDIEINGGTFVGTFSSAFGCMNLGATVGGKTGSVTFNITDGTFGEYGYAFRTLNLLIPEVNITGGTFAQMHMSSSAAYAHWKEADGADNVITEDITGEGKSGRCLVQVTIDGATVGEYYGGKSGGNASLTRSVRSILKSGTFGSVYLFNTTDFAQNTGRDSADNELFWITLGDPSYTAATKPLTIGEYYASSYNAVSDTTYVGNATAITQVYSNLVLDPDVLEGGYSGAFYAIGNEKNTAAGENSGIYAVDVVLDVHGFDLDTRSNDHLFGNVKLEGSYAGAGTYTRTGNVYINVEDVTLTRGIPGKVGGTQVDDNNGMLFDNIVGTSTVSVTDAHATRTFQVFNGDLSITLNNVTLGESGSAAPVDLIGTMQFLGNIKNDFTDCTVNGRFCALSNAQLGNMNTWKAAMTSSYSYNFANALNVFTGCTFNGNVMGGAMNSLTVGNIKNVVTDCTINGYFSGNSCRSTSVVGPNGIMAGTSGSDAGGSWLSSGIGTRSQAASDGHSPVKGTSGFDFKGIVNVVSGNTTITGKFLGCNVNGQDRCATYNEITGTAQHPVTIGSTYTGKGITSSYFDTVNTLTYVNVNDAFYATTSGSTPTEINTTSHYITNTLDHVNITGAFVGGGSVAKTATSINAKAITNTLTDTTVGGNFHGAFSQATTVTVTNGVSNNLTRTTVGGTFYATGSNGASTVTTFKGSVSNTFNTVTVTGDFMGAGKNVIGTADAPKSVTSDVTNLTTPNYYGTGEAADNVVYGTVSNTVNGLTLTTGNYFGAGRRPVTGSVTNAISGTIDLQTADKTLYLGAFDKALDAGAGNQAVTSTITNANLNAYVVGGTYTATVTGNVTTTFDNVDISKYLKANGTDTVAYIIYGGGNSALGTITGNVTNNFGGSNGPLTVGAAVFGGGNGTINGKLTTNVYKFGANRNGAEYAFYAGQNQGVINNPGATALEVNIIPENDSDVWFNTGTYCGSYQGAINGDIEITVTGGIQYSSRQFGIGQYQTTSSSGASHYVVDGDITANIYGGNWGAICLGARNYTRADTEVGVTGDVTLNLYGGNVGAINKGFGAGQGLYTGGDTIVNIYTTDAPAPYTAKDLVLRSIVDGAARTYSTDAEHPNTPYVVNVIAGDRTLYFAQNSSSATTAQESSVFDSVTGTLKVQPAPAGVGYMEVPDWIYGGEPYYAGTSYGYEGAYDYASTFSITVKGTTSEATIDDQEGPYSVLTFTTDGTDSTWTGNNLRLSHIAGEQVVMGTRFTVRVLLDRAQVERITVTNAGEVGVTYSLNNGEPVAVTALTSGTGDLADYYYFDVTGIAAKDYKDATIEVNMTRPGLAAVTSDTLTGSGILADLEEVGANETEITNNTKLANAIGEFADAMAAYANNQNPANAPMDIPAGAVEDVTDEQVNAKLAESDTPASTQQTVVAEHVKAIGVSLTVSDTVRINYWFHITPGYNAEISSAAINGVALDLGAEGVLTRRYNGDEPSNYWTVSYECNANELATMLTLTVNGGSTGFSACPLSYAKALRDQAPELAQAIVNYAYYVNAYAVKV